MKVDADESLPPPDPNAAAATFANQVIKQLGS